MEVNAYFANLCSNLKFFVFFVSANLYVSVISIGRMFLSAVKRLRIMRTSDANGLCKYTSLKSILQ